MKGTPYCPKWEKGIYPVLSDIAGAIGANTLYIATENHEIIGAFILNHFQGEGYQFVNWQTKDSDDGIAVLHLLATAPACQGKGVGKKLLGILLAGDGNMPQVVRDVLQLFSSRGGRLTVFSQRSPRAVRAVLGGLRLAAPALTCGGTLAYRFSEGSGQPLCSFAGCEESIFKKLPAAVGLGIALQMADGSTRVLRMSTALERHLRREFTPFTLCSPADVKGEDVLRILLYQDRQQLPIQALLEKALGDNAAMLRSERTGMDVMVLTPGAVSAEAMLGAVCLPVNCTADQLTVAAGCSQMLELVRQARQSVVPADAPVELRLAASQTTLTDHDTGAAAEFFYGLVRSAEAAS